MKVDSFVKVIFFRKTFGYDYKQDFKGAKAFVSASTCNLNLMLYFIIPVCLKQSAHLFRVVFTYDDIFRFLQSLTDALILFSQYTLVAVKLVYGNN